MPAPSDNDVFFYFLRLQQTALNVQIHQPQISAENFGRKILVAGVCQATNPTLKCGSPEERGERNKPRQ